MPDEDTVAREIAVTRQVAEHEALRLERALSGSTDQLLKMSGWLTASLLAINGAGALATLNAAPNANDLTIPGLLFGGGILTAMLSAVAIQSFQEAVAGPLDALINYWRGAQIYGERDTLVEEELRKPLNKVNRFSFVPPAIGWLSGLLFFAGAITLALIVAQPDQAALNRCEVLQRDMTSLEPRRADSRELFTALGCKQSGTTKIEMPKPAKASVK
jgi:hypothetical protein